MSGSITAEEFLMMAKKMGVQIVNSVPEVKSEEKKAERFSYNKPSLSKKEAVLEEKVTELMKLVPTRCSQNSLSDERIAGIFRLHLKGKTLKEVIALSGCSRSAVITYLTHAKLYHPKSRFRMEKIRQAALKKKDRNSITPFEAAKIAYLRVVEGKSVQEILPKVVLSERSVYRVISLFKGAYGDWEVES